jgi:hypothetical protein
MDIDRQFWKFSPMTGSSQKSQNQFWPFYLGFFKIEKASDKICRVFGGTITEHKNRQGILENGMPTSAGIPFSKMPCIVFFPLVMASPSYSSKACGLQPYPTQNSLVKEPNLNHSGFLASSFMKSDNFSSNILKTWNPRFITLWKLSEKQEPKFSDPQNFQTT